jgi:HPt (histidine-containing phosphotransfer) domain-containing protein
VGVTQCSDQALTTEPLPWTKSNVMRDLERDGQWSFVKELIDTFLEDTASRIEGLRKAARAADMAALASGGHTLKGSAQVMNVIPLVELSSEMEGWARLNEQRDYLSLVDRLDLALAEVRQAMTSYGRGLPRNV